MPATTYTLDYIIEYVFGKRAYDPGATYYFGLSQALIGANGATVTEPTGGYARVTFTNNDTNWGDATSGALINDVAVTFPESDNVAGWGTILSIFIANSGTTGAGDVLWYYNLNPTLAIGDNTIVSFPIGAIMASMT